MLLIFLFFLPASLAIWKCPTRPQCDKFNGGEMSAKDKDLLVEAMKVDGFAEFKYRHECYTAEELAAQAKVDLRARARPDPEGDLVEWNDLQECNPGTRFPLRIPGSEEMAFGYNIVTDKPAKAHGAILNVRNTSAYRSTVRDDRTGKCYVVPDAFVSEGAYGVIFKYKSSQGFAARGSSSLQVYRQNKVKSRQIELSLGVAIPLVAAIAAGFSTSEKTTFFKTNTDEESEDSSELIYLQSTHELHVQAPIPTKEIIAVWRQLYFVKNTTEDYMNYFSQYGTHYYVDAEVGGRFTVLFTTKKSLKKALTSNSQNRATCASTKLAAVVEGGTSVATNATACTAAYGEDFKSKDFNSTVQTSGVFCEGGYQCPSDTTDPLQFHTWRESLQNSSVLLGGSKKWIHELIEIVADRARQYPEDEEDGNDLRKIILAFARPETDPEKAIKIFEAFKDELRNKTVAYLQTNTFCENPSNCVPEQPKTPIIEGVSQSGWGSWYEMEECDQGEVAMVVKRFVGPYGVPDESGLNRIELRCGLPGSGEASTKIISSGSLDLGRAGADETCLDGYLSGIKIYSVKDRGVTVSKPVTAGDIVLGWLSPVGYLAGKLFGSSPNRDNLGVTNVAFKCTAMDTGKKRSLPEQVESPKEAFESGWTDCPSTHAICGIQTLVEADQGEDGDDTAINNVRLKCCQLPTPPK